MLGLTLVLAARGSGLAAPALSAFTLVLAASGSGLAETALSGFTLVVAASGSGFAEVPDPALFAAPGPLVLTAVVAASGLGFSESLSGALWLPTGLLPTPVLPRGLGWNGDEQKARCQQAPWQATTPPAKSLRE